MNTFKIKDWNNGIMNKTLVTPVEEDKKEEKMEKEKKEERDEE